MIKTEYVLGFAFDKHDNVLLIEKTKPAWQRGLLNGAGGKIEGHDDNSIAAMMREFYEETGILTAAWMWRPITVMTGDDWIVYVLTATVDFDLRPLDGKGTDTDETIRIVHTGDLYKADTISNVPWLVGLCLDEQMPVSHYTVTFT